MPIIFNCKYCGEELEFGDGVFGAQVMCDHCRKIVRVPDKPGAKRSLGRVFLSVTLSLMVVAIAFELAVILSPQLQNTLGLMLNDKTGETSRSAAMVSRLERRLAVRLAVGVKGFRTSEDDERVTNEEDERLKVRREAAARLEDIRKKQVGSLSDYVKSYLNNVLDESIKYTKAEAEKAKKQAAEIKKAFERLSAEEQAYAAALAVKIKKGEPLTEKDRLFIRLHPDLFEGPMKRYRPGQEMADDPFVNPFESRIELLKEVLSAVIVKDFARAVSVLSVGTKKMPRAPEVYAIRGFIRTAVEKNYLNAIDDLGKAIELSPGDALVYYFRGDAFFRLKNLEHTKQDFAKAIQLKVGLSSLIEQYPIE